jgi:hypothetical protein
MLLYAHCLKEVQQYPSDLPSYLVCEFSVSKISTEEFLIWGYEPKAWGFPEIKCKIWGLSMFDYSLLLSF